MENLIEMQKHIEALRTENQSLREQLEKEVNRNKLFKRNTFVVLCILSIAWIGTYLWQDYQTTLISEQLKAETQRKLNFRDMLVVVDEERNNYAYANEQLIKHCRPCDVNRAIKATPLPKLEIK